MGAPYMGAPYAGAPYPAWAMGWPPIRPSMTPSAWREFRENVPCSNLPSAFRRNAKKETRKEEKKTVPHPWPERAAGSWPWPEAGLRRPGKRRRRELKTAAMRKRRQKRKKGKTKQNQKKKPQKGHCTHLRIRKVVLPHERRVIIRSFSCLFPFSPFVLSLWATNLCAFPDTLVRPKCSSRGMRATLNRERERRKKRRRFPPRQLTVHILTKRLRKRTEERCTQDAPRKDVGNCVS